MGIKNLVSKNRSYRRFYENVRIPKSDLIDLIELARLSPSAKNLQNFKYHVAFEEELCDQIFPLTAWAGYLKDWKGPEKGERPTAYITVLHDTNISDNRWTDQGISTQSILLGAVEKGYGGCIIASVKRNELHRLLKLPEHLEIVYIIALGKPKEIIQIDEIEDNDHKYWRDNEEIHHVPKRRIEEILINY